MSHDDLIDLAEVYALGALEGDELGEYQAHLQPAALTAGHG